MCDDGVTTVTEIVRRWLRVSYNPSVANKMEMRKKKYLRTYVGESTVIHALQTLTCVCPSHGH